MRKTLIWLLIVAISVNMAISLVSALPTIFNPFTGKLDYYGMINGTCSGSDFINGITVNGTFTCATPTTSTNWTNVAFTNQTTSWGVNNITAGNFFGLLNWSWLQNIPSYVKDWDYKLNATDQRYNETSLALAVNDTAKDKYNATYDATSKDVTANRTDFLSTYNSTYAATTGDVTANRTNWDSTYNSTYAGKADYQFNNNNFNGSGNITTTGDIRVEGDSYFYGQPLLGMMGSGIISTSSLADRTELNISCTGLTCSYPNFTMRIVSGTGANSVYCNIPNGTFTAVDNQQSVRYVDNACAVQVSEFTNYFNNVIGNGNVWDFSMLTCHDGTCEVFRGGSIENRRNIGARVISFYTDHLRVVDGMNWIDGSGRNFSIGSGKYLFMQSPVTTSLINTTSSNIEYFYHNGTNYSNVDIVGGLDLARCDNGTDLVTCTGSSYRRYYIYMVGWNQTGHTQEIVQTAGLLGTTYTLANCLNTITNPLVTNLPNYYTETAVPLYAYCGQRADTTLTSANLIDLRTVKTGSATGSATETDPVWTVASANYVPYSSGTSNLVLTGFNITGDWFFGKINWSDVKNAPTSDWLSTYNSTYADTSADVTANKTNWLSTYNVTYDTTTLDVNANRSDWLSTYNSTYAGKAGTGNCNAGDFVTNTTTSGVVCATPSSGGAFNQTYDDTSKDVTANRTSWFSTFNQTYADWNKTYADTLYWPIASGSYNATYAETSADVTANKSNWISTYNATYAGWAYNMTTPAIDFAWANFWNMTSNFGSSSYNVTADWFKGQVNWSDVKNAPTSDWLSTYNSTYDATSQDVTANRTNFLSTYNSTYDAKVDRAGDTMTGNLNMSTNNITDIGYIKLIKIAGACDLTINGSICSNATGTYIVG